ncbi:hypothetical protein HYDPIDRAFT_177707 [Hydnomerulius pinastri MD-312]|uniref:Uncharacterized protein n=1 Tax=Hydnomerulius pinastri MD-312 TaxID=994086 RepID=A0A0C9W989_9AGAM|nr:hypothetical protein HYDPIDRAFT_177707 [Hydnomerulius pinastri MD-312]
MQLYDSLPPDAQQLLVQKQLVPLLNSVPKDKAKKVTASATEMQRKYAGMPALNLKAKKSEICSLLLELSRDSKRSFIKERSRREEFLSEVVDSLAQWLGDVWKVVYEYRANFRVAHACLLFASDALDQIGTVCGGCKCSYANMFIPVKIRSSSGRLVKSFSLTGAHNLERVMLWIWRDLFVTMLATGTKRQRKNIPEMLDDIRTLLGWRSLEHLLYGGRKTLYEEEDDDDEEQYVHSDREMVGEWLNVVDDDGDDNYTSDDCSTTCDEELYPRGYYASHWSWRISDQQTRLRGLVHETLLGLFKIAPSAPLFASMAAIAEDEDDLDDELHPILMTVATYSSENFSAALRILSLNNKSESLNHLLSTHKHLLRSQDAASLQFATLIMSGNFFYRPYALSIVHEELTDVSNALCAAVRSSFCHIQTEAYKTELTQILALRQDSLNRRSRVERWVKNVLTPQPEHTHPMALAALMMGIPLPPGMEGGDEGDMLGYFEIDGDDPELEDLKEEFRPNLKARLTGWVDTGMSVKGGQAILLKVYTKVVEDMPFLNANDVVEEMSARLSERPSKHHICDALEAFRDFCKKQRKRVVLNAKKEAQTKGAATRASTSASGSGSASFVPLGGSTPSPNPGIMDDVD